MKHAMREAALGIAFIAAYVYLFRFLHTFPTKVELGMFWIKELPPVVLNVAAWCLWIWHRRTQNEPWKQAVAWFSLIGNALVICLPLFAFNYDAFVFAPRGRLGSPSILPSSAGLHVEPTLRFCLIFSIALLVLGFAAPRRIRLAVVLGGFASAWFLMTVSR